MNLFAIGDLHLPGGQHKPMDVFGSHWTDHAEKIKTAWLDRVDTKDVVLMPGDLSWAMTREEARDDFAYLQALPGKIVLIRGNHDYWWDAIGRVRAALPANVFALQNDHYALPGGSAVCGTRGWDIPQQTATAHDEKVYERELGRLELSLQSAVKAGLHPDWVMLHYPPAPHDGRATPMTEMLEKYGVTHCVYGHLHGDAVRWALTGTVRGVTYHLASCDALNFKPLFLHCFSDENGCE